MGHVAGMIGRLRGSGGERRGMRVRFPVIFGVGLAVVGLMTLAWGDSVSYATMVYGYGWSLVSDASAFYVEYDYATAGIPFGIHREGSGSGPEAHLPGFEWDRTAAGLTAYYRVPYPVLLGSAVVAWLGCLGWSWRGMRRARAMKGDER